MKKQFTPREIADFCRQMALMLHAGIGAAEALELILQEEQNSTWRAVLEHMVEITASGRPFAEAVQETDGLPAYMVGLIEMGERTGNLEESLLSLAQYYEERERLNRRVRDALLYPSVLFLIMMVVIVLLLTRVLPMFRSVYASLGGELTGVAGMLMNLGSALNSAMPVLCVLFGALVLLVALLAMSNQFRDRVIRLWRTRMGDKGVMRTVNDACFAQAVSMGIGSGLSAEESMELAAHVLTDTPSAQKRCMDCKDALARGESFVDALCGADIFPPAERRLLDLGLKSGNGDTTMRELARRLSEDADLALNSRVSRVEPALVLICSLLVGAVLLSVMLPLIDIMEMIG